MENKILTTENWQQRIRDKMGVDDAYLPDSVLEQPDCIGIAEANIISMIPNYSTLDSDSKLYLETAVVLECCILLSPSMSARLPKKEGGPHASHELYINWDNKKAEFQEERNSYIGKIIDLEFPELLSSSLPHFTVTYPIRKW
ncbi:hypothetical protein ACR77J_11950 [Tissierella praeacuta]|uniref:hypothetical protein n=1 Tax=Tissierella praeacuta TaxID=43131 RepID=UPI001049E3C1|nr:hypothetical protein [Tissierella praeacuta]TCU72838.1 hypothetical protein EV204_105174 [Tissierella praeacuta]